MIVEGGSLMKVLLVASEAYPFIKTGGLGYTTGFLPKALKKKDIDVRVVIPKYKNLDSDIKKKLDFIKWYTVKLGWRNQYCGVLKYEKVCVNKSSATNTRNSKNCPVCLCNK